MSEALGFPVSQWVIDFLTLFGGAIGVLVMASFVCRIWGVDVPWRRR